MSSYKLMEARFDESKSFHRMSAIHVTGTSVSGKPFQGTLFLEMDGRDMDWEGTTFGNDDFEELMEPLLGAEDSVYDTVAYQEATSWYHDMPVED